MESGGSVYENEYALNPKATELKLGLPGREEDSRPSSTTSMKNNKRSSPENDVNTCQKAQVVGWPPVRSFRKNAMRREESAGCGMYVKVSMDGAPYLRKIDLKQYGNYSDLVKALENMFKCTIGVYTEREGYNGSEYAPTYEDKDGDWMLVGDVPWEIFTTSCRRLRVMKGSEAKGLGCI